MAGYSGTPLPKKLGIKPESTLALVSAPEDFDATLGELPEGVHTKDRAGGRADVVVAFFTERSKLEKRLGPLAKVIHPDGGLWVAWPKRASGVSTDITEDVVRELGLAGGLVDNKVCAIDDTWSGLRLVYRLRDRPKKG
jgi:hypothetical protein